MPVLRRDTVIPLADYPSGSREFNFGRVQDDARGFTVELARCTTAAPDIWPDAGTTVDLSLEASFDNGQTWIPAGAFGASGGIFVNRAGTPSAAELPITKINVPFPAGNNRRLRATLEITNGPLRTTGALELWD